MRHFEIDHRHVSPLSSSLSPRPRPTRRRGLPLSPLAPSARHLLVWTGRGLDGVAVVMAGLAAPQVSGAAAAPGLVLAVLALLAVNVSALAGVSDEDGFGRRGALAAGLLIGGLLPPAAWAALHLAGSPVSPMLLVAWSLGGAGLVVAFRLGWGALLGRAARWPGAARRVLIVGDRDRAFDVLALLAGAERRWAFPVALCLDRDPPERPMMGGFVAGLGEAERLVRDQAVDDVVVALPWGDAARLSDCLARLRPLAVDVHLFPDATRPYADGEALSLLGGMPMAKLGSRPLAGLRAMAKSAEDMLLAALLVVALSPLMALIALAIKLDSPGPVLFRQPRYGFDNQPFTCFKFRSMHHRPPEAETRQATRDDPRVTRVGRVLRRTSLDELPQLFNVLNGTMSLVGPRPHAVSHHHTYARLVDDYRCRHRMKPGLTGWAQIHGFRGETTTVDMMRQRVAHDLWYIDHWSPWLDLSILAKTPRACLKGTNAY